MHWVDRGVRALRVPAVLVENCFKVQFVLALMPQGTYSGQCVRHSFLSDMFDHHGELDVDAELFRALAVDDR